MENDTRIFQALAVRSNQGTVHLQTRLMEPNSRPAWSNTVNCSQAIKGSVIAQAASVSEIRHLITCERCCPTRK